MQKIPFEAAIFDLDGTVLDSLSVWKRVDEMWFSRRGMPVPENYAHEIAGLSFRESAEYTVARYAPEMKWETVIDEWTELTGREYVESVPLKPGAREYLCMLRREGVKLAVATACLPMWFEPCLKRLKIDELFDAVCCVDETGGSKEDGQVFLLAAKKLGVKPERCAVFEDVPAGVIGAKRVGMQAYGMFDAHHSEESRRRTAENADRMLHSFEDMRAVHDFSFRRAVIFTAHCEGSVQDAYSPLDGDRILCADGGWKFAREASVKPECVIGDFDSSEEPEGEAIERHPVMKDDTDTMLCVKRALKGGELDFLIVGGFGGRLDHTLANIQTMQYLAERGARAVMDDGITRAETLKEGKTRVSRKKGKLSVFSLTDKCEGVTIRGAKYELENGTLTNAFPLGVSNEYAESEAQIEVRKGCLLIIQESRE